ncbi:MAG: hypothetical protein C5B49_03425 [Bdellovibrio sp.]|nr:MAG: hypothetical protein C5B49_03425 [Bdellovibrio sp.]
MYYFFELLKLRKELLKSKFEFWSSAESNILKDECCFSCRINMSQVARPRSGMLARPSSNTVAQF